MAKIKPLMMIIRLLTFDFLGEGLEFSDGLQWNMLYNEHRQVQGLNDQETTPCIKLNHDGSYISI